MTYLTSSFGISGLFLVRCFRYILPKKKCFRYKLNFKIIKEYITSFKKRTPVIFIYPLCVHLRTKAYAKLYPLEAIVLLSEIFFGIFKYKRDIPDDEIKWTTRYVTGVHYSVLLLSPVISSVITQRVYKLVHAILSFVSWNIFKRHEIRREIRKEGEINRK